MKINFTSKLFERPKVSKPDKGNPYSLPVTSVTSFVSKNKKFL